MNTFATRTEVIEQAVLPALHSDASAPDDFDTDAIFDACFTWDADCQAFIQTADADAFWATVEANAY